MSIERGHVRSGIRHRRGFLVASAAMGAAMLLPTGASAVQIKVLQGSVRVNGKPATKGTVIRAGDTVQTAKGARLAFVVGEDAFLLRGESKLMLEHTNSAKGQLVSGLRLLSGGLLAAFAPGPRRVETPTATAGLRGTAVYVEASAEQTYFCTCYGVVELRDKAGVERKMVVSGYHTGNMIYANPAEHGKMAAAEFKDHTDAELIMLERLVGRTSPIVQRNEKLKQSIEPVEPKTSAPEQKAIPEQKAAPEQKPAPEKQAAPADRSPPEKQAVPDEQPVSPSKDLSKPAAEDKQLPKSASKQKQKAKPAPKPGPEKATQPPAEKTPDSVPPELGPAPMPPPASPQPPAEEWRLPPPRLDQ